MDAIFHDEIVKVPQNQKFIECVALLTARYPCNETDDGTYDDVWVDEPMDGICHENVYVIGILKEFIAEVQPFVISTANRIGLVVYDMQLGKVYLPTGTVLESARTETIVSKPWWKLW